MGNDTCSGSFEAVYRDLQAILDAPGVPATAKGDAFEDVVRWLLLHDPTYGLVGGDVRLWRDAPIGDDSQGRPWRWHAQDTGTDALAYPRDGSAGELVAIQAKAWERSRAVPKEEVDSFLADSNRPHVVSRIFATTADKLNAKALATLQGQEKPVTLVTFGTLLEAPVSWPSSLEDLRKELQSPAGPGSPKEPAQLRPYQKQVVQEAVGFFAAGGTRGKVVMACGTGKTLVAQRLTEELSPDRVLALFPSLMLLKQTLHSWLLNATPSTGEFDWIAVCSDETVTGKNEDRLVSTVAELGLPNVTTNPDHIREFLERNDGRCRRVVFSTYHSSPQVAAALAGTNTQFDLMLCDEAHRMARVTNTTKKTNPDPFTTGLDDTLISASKRVFLTATPKVYGSRVKKKAEETAQETLVMSMDDENVFGPMVATYTFKQAIEGDGSDTGPVLADYRILAVTVTDKEVQKLIEDRSYLAVEDSSGDVVAVEDSHTLATQVAVIKALQNPRYGINSLITYHHTVANACAFQSGHNRYREALGMSPIHVDVVKGTDPAFARSEKLKALGSGSPALVSNARCLTEGVDVPLLDAVAFIDPKKSKVDIVQAVGRVIRRPAGSEKGLGYVIIPVYLTDEIANSFAGGLQSELSAAFQDIIHVLGELRSVDPLIVEAANLATRSHQRWSTPNKEGVDLPIEVLTDNDATAVLGDTTVALDEFAHAIHLALVDAVSTELADPWWDRYTEYKEWIESDEGQSSRPWAVDDYGKTAVAFARWVRSQRAAHATGQLKADKAVALASLPNWRWVAPKANQGDPPTQLSDHCSRAKQEEWRAMHSSRTTFSIGVDGTTQTLLSQVSYRAVNEWGLNPVHSGILLDSALRRLIDDPETAVEQARGKYNPRINGRIRPRVSSKVPPALISDAYRALFTKYPDAPRRGFPHYVEMCLEDILMELTENLGECELFL